VVVDGVEEVLNISAADIEETPDFGSHVAADCIIGMAKIKGAVKTLLDIDSILRAEALDRIKLPAVPPVAVKTI
jgi:purine-binding chemotaxis protein CheW